MTINTNESAARTPAVVSLWRFCLFVYFVFIKYNTFQKNNRPERLRAKILGFTENEFKIQITEIFFHPDYTVGLGISPNQPKNGSQTLLPVGNYTPP